MKRTEYLYIKKTPVSWKFHKAGVSLYKMYLIKSDIYFRVIVAALQQFLHFLLTWLSWIGAGAGIKDRIGCDIMKSI